MENVMAKHYIGACKDVEVRNNSSSGGIFTVLSNYVFDNDGIVFAATYDQYDYSIKHIMITNADELWKVRKSKYVWSNFKGIEIEMREQIAMNRLVMFVGTPCQAAYIRNKVFFKRTPEPIVLDIFPIDYYNDDISFEQLQNIDMQLKKEFDGNTDKSAVKRDKWYKAIRSSGKIVSKMESSHLCYGLETDFIKMCNSYFSLNYVLPLKKINFENKVFLGPGNPDKMLEMEYGDYMQWPNDAGSTAHGANRRFSRYKNYSNPRYIHTKSEAEDFCKEINEKAGDYQLIVEKYKIFNWKEYFDIVDYLDEHDISYIVYA